MDRRTNAQVVTHTLLIFLTTYGDEKTVEEAMNTEPDGYLMKPFELVDIYTSIKATVTSYGARNGADGQKENVILKDSLFIREDHLYIKIRFDQIHYLKSPSHQVVQEQMIIWSTP